MGQVGISLKKVSTTRRFCKKPGCRTGSYRISRHHKRHQSMFVSSFVRSRRTEARYEAFVKRYYDFNKQDVVDVCEHHHMEIHVIYDRIIQKDRDKTKKRLSDYTWDQAEKLMDKLEARCLRWLKEKTPGIKPTRKRPTKGGYQKAVADLKETWEL